LNITTAIKSQYDYSLEMLYDVINACPDNLWNDNNGVFPFWQQVYHALYWSDYSIQESFNGSRKFCWETDKDVSHELEENEITCSDYLTKYELNNYFHAFIAKKDSFFNSLNDESLLEKISFRNDDLTWFDILTNQIRHIMYHVGYCDSILKDNGYCTVEWVSIFGKQE